MYKLKILDIAFLKAASGIAMVLVLSACTRIPSLMPTPSIYVEQTYDESKIHEKFRVPEAEILYVTDRAIEVSSKAAEGEFDQKEIRYGNRRASSMAFGTAKVTFKNKDIDWTSLLAASSSSKRRKPFKYILDSVDEVGRFPASPYRFARTANGIELVPEVAAHKIEETGKLNGLINERLSKTHVKDVILYVHGFHNTFNDAAFTMTGLWHFYGRQGVPIIYSWPAGRGGLTGYFTDRESGEFTIFHFKETLRALAAMPNVENIHIISHSRGTDVTTTALRELVIENRAAGINPLDSLKIRNLVLAAPDLDFEVMQQRLMAEHFGPAIGKITIYTSRQDKALRLSQLVMSGLRFGRVRANDVGVNEQEVFAAAGNVDFIQVPKDKRFVGHSYFHNNPAVSADLIKVIKSHSKAGSPERPMLSLGGNFWKMGASDSEIESQASNTEAREAN